MNNEYNNIINICRLENVYLFRVYEKMHDPFWIQMSKGTIILKYKLSNVLNDKFIENTSGY